jgi:chlorophyll/bacteriochlorophyll a synthase
MSRPASTVLTSDIPPASVVLELLKPITWFPPIWAFACGVVSAGTPLQGRWTVFLAGVVLCGPLLCATSQAVNDWFDRTVDAINEPTRPIPSGRMPGRWGLYVAVLWSLLSMACAAALGPWVFGASAAGLILAWAYSAPPVRLKQNGWWGNLACAACYEGLAWLTGAVVASSGAAPSIRILGIAALYSAGAHGIMTLNDFKSIEGDRRTGIGSLPVRLGAEHAGEVACVTMALPQLVVVALLAAWGRPHQAIAVAGLLGAQLLLMRRLLVNPRERAPWYNGTGVSLFVAGMMVSAFALKGLAP